MAQDPATRRTSARPSGRAATPRGPRLHLGRLAVLGLVLVAAALYVPPLRSFFAQQDRFHTEAAALAAARSDNAALKRQIDLLSTKSYIAEEARSESMLVPPGTMVFVIKGLPGKDQERRLTTPSEPVASSVSVLDRLEDLWRTLAP
jgi:cell division protein FtsB